MNLENHKIQFEKIVKKYNLFEERKAEEITKYLVNKDKIDLEEFSNIFAIQKIDAEIFLSFIHKGLKFKEEHLDKK